MDDREYAGLLRETMTELTTHFARPTEIDVSLRSVTSRCVHLIEGVDCADIAMISGADHFLSVAPTSRLALHIHDLQRLFREGPCLDAAAGNSPVLSNDLREDKRWPNFGGAAVSAGVRSLMSFQLYTHDTRAGALNMFALEPDMFTAEAEAVGAMLATHAAIALIADDERLQFRSALASRDIIGQAKGMIMERFQVDAVRAFELLVRLSQNSNIRVAEIAEEIVSRGPEPRP